jgi:thioester reductase-like protein
MNEEVSVASKMQDLINKYSDFKPVAGRQIVVLTGATDSFGAHVLAQLVSRPDVETVHCLVRANDCKDAARRVQKSLLQRKLYHSLSLSAHRKITALSADLSDPLLGLDSETYKTVTQGLTGVIHCAWSVNFNLNLLTFEKDCISGVRHLLSLCLAVPTSKPASFDFCSSVSTVSRCPHLHTPEVVADLDWAQGVGYAQSKCVAEHMCVAAAQKTGIKTRILRVDQIVTTECASPRAR